MADVPARTELKVTTGPIRGSRKIYVEGRDGVHALTRALAVEYAKRGVRCNSVCPASIDTAMGSPKFPDGVDMKLLMRPASLHFAVAARE